MKYLGLDNPASVVEEMTNIKYVADELISGHPGLPNSEGALRSFSNHESGLSQTTAHFLPTHLGGLAGTCLYLSIFAAALGCRANLAKYELRLSYDSPSVNCGYLGKILDPKCVKKSDKYEV